MSVTSTFGSDTIHLTVKREGRETCYLLHKTCTFVALDSRWLLNPDGNSQTGRFLKEQTSYSYATAPRGYGYLVVDFDHKTIESFQSYKDTSIILMDEFGYHGGSSPTWMDWKATLNDAFANGCITEVVYVAQKSDASGRQKIVQLPLLAQSRPNLALRFCSTQKPPGHSTLGVGFKPPGWAMTDVSVPTNKVARRTVCRKMLDRLRKIGISIAPEPQWNDFINSY